MPIAEIRYDHMTDRALLDEESTVALRKLSKSWAKAHPVVVRAKSRQALMQRSWRAMAALRAAHIPFELTRVRYAC